MNDNVTKDILNVYSILAERYEIIINDYKDDFISYDKYTSKEHILNMLKSFSRNDKDLTIDKASRSFGYIQGILACQGVIDIEYERNHTRPFFQLVYTTHNIKQQTINF